MKKICFTCLSLFVVTTLCGCVDMPKQKFIDEAKSLSEKPIIEMNLSLPPVKKYDVNEKIDKFYRQLLGNPAIAAAIYDEAVSMDKVWSFDSVIGNKWFAKLFVRGISRVKDEDRIALIRLVSNKYASASRPECSLLKKDTMFIYPLFDSDEADEFFRLQFNALLAATEKSESNELDMEKAAYVALLALTAKAKDDIPDKELGEILYSIKQKNKTSAGVDCKTISKIMILANSLEPKYRSSIFKILELR
jgi:hypothetical protein